MSEEQADMVKKPRPGPVTRSQTASAPGGTAKKACARRGKASDPNILVVLNAFDNNDPPDAEYAAFLKKLPMKERKELKQLESDLLTRFCAADVQPLKYRLLKAAMPDDVKARLLMRLQRLAEMGGDDAEAGKLRAWFEAALALPLGRLACVPAARDAGSDKLAAFMASARAALDAAVYGMANVKERILQLVAQTVNNPGTSPTAISLEGPAGVGKTRLLSHGLARVLGRPFVSINLGGAKDGSFLTGHDYTYLGARPGQLADALVRAGCMNPVVHFDELDKVSDSAQGQEVVGVLMHLVDATQVSRLQDRYLAQVPLDFSRALFTFSFNDASKIDPILLDRILRLQVPGYGPAEKVAIAAEYLLPDIMTNVGLTCDDVLLDREDIRYIVRRYAGEEPGVRLLRKCIETVLLSINVTLLCGDQPRPYVVTQDIIDRALRSTIVAPNAPPPGMYC